MNLKTTSTISMVLASLAILLTACPSSSTNNPNPTGEIDLSDSKRAGINEVVIHELGDPDKLNAITSTSANSTYIEDNIYMYLLDVNKETLELTGALAVDRPTVSEPEEGEYAGGLKMEYEIRPEAVWDNGEPVTAYDVDFTYKATKNPHVDAEPKRPYIDFIHEVVIDPANPKKFTIYSKDKYFMAEYGSGNTIPIVPEYVADPEGIMRQYTVKELSNPDMKSDHMADPDLKRFADDFNSEKFQREPGFVVGCGPYKFKEWITGQRIILEKKDGWWGEALMGKEWGFVANPTKLIYEIIDDQTTAVTALKGEDIDLMRSILPKDFQELETSGKFTAKYRLHTPVHMSYVYIGLNMKSPKLEDLRVRKALAMAIDKDQIIESLMYGMAEPCNGPIHYTKDYYNDQIPGYSLDLAQAAALMDEAGWKDSDGDGIRDKMINGKKTSLSLTYKYNSGNKIRENIGLIYQQNLAAIGVELNIVTKEWTVYLDEVKNHDFELMCLGWVQDPSPDDLKQIWHTESYNGGSNYTGFGNANTDQLIEDIRREMDEGKRKEMYLQFQEIVYEQVPYIFIYVPYERIAIHGRFNNADTYVARPGYVERGFELGASSVPMADN